MGAWLNSNGEVAGHAPHGGPHLYHTYATRPLSPPNTLETPTAPTVTCNTCTESTIRPTGVNPFFIQLN